MSDLQARRLRVIRGAEGWMCQLVARKSVIPLELVRAWIMAKYGLGN